MPRRPRLHVPGGLYHVILRGNGRQAIFFDADDRRRWETLLAHGLDRYGHRLHAYCWMTNHVHLAIQCHENPLANFMRSVASRYARSTNKKLGRSGHLFERRHRAILVDADAYLLQLVRYIHRNPLRAGLVERLSLYPWSSHAAYRTGAGPGWLTRTWVLGMFGDTCGAARRRYHRFMADDDPPGPAQQFSQGGEADHRLLGSETFATSISDRPGATIAPGSLTELASEVCRQHSVSLSELRSPSRARRFARARAELGYRALDAGIATNAEVARFLNRCPAAISQAVLRYRQALKK